MTEVALIAIAILNILLLISSETPSYEYSFFAHTCLFLSIPIGLVSASILVILGGAFVPLLLASVAITLSVLHALVVMADGPGGG